MEIIVEHAFLLGWPICVRFERTDFKSSDMKSKWNPKQEKNKKAQTVVCMSQITNYLFYTNLIPIGHINHFFLSIFNSSSFIIRKMHISHMPPIHIYTLIILIAKTEIYALTAQLQINVQMCAIFDWDYKRKWWAKNGIQYTNSNSEKKKQINKQCANIYTNKYKRISNCWILKKYLIPNKYTEIVECRSISNSSNKKVVCLSAYIYNLYTIYVERNSRQAISI